jgi:hypothetical protein
MASPELYYFIADGSDRRENHDSLHVPQPYRRASQKDKGDNGYHHHNEDEVRAAAGMCGTVFSNFLYLQRFPSFVSIYCLVLCAVISKHTSNIRHQGYRPQVNNEDNKADNSVYEVAFR